MLTVALVIAKEMFRDEEYLHPKEILEKNGIKVVTISSIKGICTGRFGAKAVSEMIIDEVDLSTLDGIFFIGGPGSKEFFDNKKAHELLNLASRFGKVIGSICAASTTLARSGVIKGKRATGFSETEADIKANGGIWTGAHVEVDGKIITADGPDSAYMFGKAIVKALKL